jgi:hypothetical protein
MRHLLLAGIGLCVPFVQLSAQDLPGRSPAAQNSSYSLPSDWSQRHVIFPAAATADRQAAVEQEARFHLQQLRRSFQQLDLESSDAEPAADQLERDWREDVGEGAYTQNRPTYPAKFSFDVSNPTPSCTKDYVVYTLPRGLSQNFNLIAYNNLYVNSSATGLCPGTTPTVLFAYNASQSSGKLSTAPALSLDGTQIAFIENSKPAQFHVLKWQAGDTFPKFPMPYNPSPLANCATSGSAPCEYTVNYGQASALFSSPFVNYATDTAYVTDGSGHVSAIYPVFTATPANPPQVLWSILIPGYSGTLTAPVYDSVSGNVFVVDATKLYYIRTSAGSAGTCSSGSPPCVGGASQTINSGAGTQATLEAPIVDSTNGWVFAFAWPGGTYKGATIVQSNTTLGVLHVAQISGTVGNSAPTSLYSGTFNSAYYNNPESGLLYACGGNNGGHVGALWAVGFNSSGMIPGQPRYGPLPLTTASVPGQVSVCSSLAEVYNQTAGKDLLFTGVTADCAFGGAGTGCVMSFDITNSFPTTALATYPSPGGSSGIVIDNVSGSLTSATDLYYLSTQPPGAGAPCTVPTGGTNTTGDCAIKLTQSGLN